MTSKSKKEAAKKPFWQNRLLWLCAGLVLAFSALYYTQWGGSTLTPKPYEYNPTTNQYWDPDHKHWHNGTPPLMPAGTSGANTQPSSNSTTAPSTSQMAANTPKPYEYNATTNQYWDPGHNHWHNGSPPPPESQKVLNALPPVTADTTAHKPYEYDLVRNQYWDPNHRHWHNGKPPIEPAPPTGTAGGK